MLGLIIVSIFLLIWSASAINVASETTVVRNDINSTSWNIGEPTQALCKSFNTKSKNADAYYQEGINLYRRGEYIESICALNEFLKSSRPNGTAFLYIGLALGSIGESDESILFFNKVIDVGSEYAYMAWFNKGLVLHKRERFDEAITAYDMAIKINENYTSAWIGKGDALYKCERFDEAITAYDRAITIYNKAIKNNKIYAQIWFNKGNALYKLGRFDEAIAAYDMAIKSDENYTKAWYNKGNALYKSENLEKVINAQACVVPQIISKVDKSKKLEKAIIAYDEAIRTDNNFEDAWYNKGDALYLLGRYSDSIKAYENVTRINRSSADAWNNKGLAFFGLGEYDKSILAYNEALNISAKYDEAWANKGLAFFKLKNYNESIEAYNNSININSKNIDAWNGKGNSLQELNRSVEAYIAFAKAKDLCDSNDFKRFIFLLFLISYILLSAMGYGFSRKFVISIEILAFFTNLLGFLALAWLFSGLYDFKSTKLILIYVLLIIAITPIFWTSLGLPMEDIWHRLVKAFTISRKNLSFFHMINKKLCILAIIIYLIISIIFSLRMVNSDMAISEMSMVLLLKLALVLILLVNLAASLPYIVNILLSVRIDHDTRNILLILQFGYLCLNALLLSAVLWIFGISHSVLSISPFFLGIMILLIVLLFLFPYFSGWQREKRWHELLLRIRLEWIDELLDIFEFPNPSQYSAKLQRLSLRIEDSIRLHEENETVWLSNAIDKDSKAKKREAIYEHALERNEPYSCHQDFLRKIHENIIECITQLGALSDDDDLLKFGRAYAELYRQRRTAISEMMEQEKNTKPLLWIGLTFGLTSIAATVLTLIGERLGPTLIEIVPKIIKGSLNVVP